MLLVECQEQLHIMKQDRDSIETDRNKIIGIRCFYRWRLIIISNLTNAIEIETENPILTFVVIFIECNGNSAACLYEILEKP